MNLVGVLDYAFRTYSILPDPSLPSTTIGSRSATPVPDPLPGEFTVATANLQRFFDTVDDAGVGDVVLTPAAFAARLNKVSLFIRHVMRSPDIIGVQEVEQLSALRAIAGKVNTDAVAAGGENPEDVAYLEDGNDPGGIDVGVLVKSSRVTVTEVSQVGKEHDLRRPTRRQPRPPSRSATADGARRGGRPALSALAVTVIVNHFRSLNDVNDPADPSGSNWVRVKRRGQAEFVANLIQDRQQSERVIVLGDLNAFEFNDGLVDLVGTLMGVPAPAGQVVLSSADLVNPDLFNVASLAPLEERYSYVFDGNAQSLDHILVSAGGEAVSDERRVGAKQRRFLREPAVSGECSGSGLGPRSGRRLLPAHLPEDVLRAADSGVRAGAVG